MQEITTKRRRKTQRACFVLVFLPFFSCLYPFLPFSFVIYFVVRLLSQWSCEKQFTVERFLIVVVSLRLPARENIDDFCTVNHRQWYLHNYDLWRETLLLLLLLSRCELSDYVGLHSVTGGMLHIVFATVDSCGD